MHVDLDLAGWAFALLALALQPENSASMLGC